MSNIRLLIIELLKIRMQSCFDVCLQLCICVVLDIKVRHFEHHSFPLKFWFLVEELGW